MLAGLAVAIPNAFRRGQVGAGDVKLAAALGALLGAKGALAVLGAGALLACGAIMLARARGGSAGRAPVPFAPFLLGGFVVMVIAGL